MALASHTPMPTRTIPATSRKMFAARRSRASCSGVGGFSRSSGGMVLSVCRIIARIFDACFGFNLGHLNRRAAIMASSDQSGQNWLIFIFSTMPVWCRRRSPFHGPDTVLLSPPDPKERDRETSLAPHPEPQRPPGAILRGAVSTASITKSRQPTKSWSGARVAVHGAPPFTFRAWRADFLGTALGPS